jgi:hypothetical protein
MPVGMAGVLCVLGRGGKGVHLFESAVPSTYGLFGSRSLCVCCMIDIGHGCYRVCSFLHPSREGCGLRLGPYRYRRKNSKAEALWLQPWPSAIGSHTAQASECSYSCVCEGVHPCRGGTLPRGGAAFYDGGTCCKAGGYPLSRGGHPLRKGGLPAAVALPIDLLLARASKPWPSEIPYIGAASGGPPFCYCSLSFAVAL